MVARLAATIWERRHGSSLRMAVQPVVVALVRPGSESSNARPLSKPSLVRARRYGSESGLWQRSELRFFQSQEASNNLSALGFWLAGVGRLDCRNLLPACLQIEAAKRSICDHSRSAEGASLGAERRNTELDVIRRFLE